MENLAKDFSNALDLDTDLYSRQLYVVGKDAMVEMAAANVLISGLGGLGVEVAKNVILGGVKSVTLHDSKPTTWFDLSSQFYLTEADLGVNRAAASLGKLRRLNDHVQVEFSAAAGEGNDLETLLAQHQVLVLTEAVELDPDELERVTRACRERGVRLILADTAGAFARVFCDFGARFVVRDPDSKEPEELVLETCSVSAGCDLVNCVVQKAVHGLRPGDTVRFIGVPGCARGSVAVVKGNAVTVTPERRISDDWARRVHSGSFIARVTQPVQLEFDDYVTSVKNPKMCIVDETKRGSASQVHVLFLAAQACYKELRVTGNGVNDPKTSRNPHLDVGHLLKHYETISKSMKNPPCTLTASDALARNFETGSYGNLCPLNAFIGGFVAQEVFKACSRKFMPLQQWLFYDAVECLPPMPGAIITNPNPGRYFGQETCIGADAQRRLQNLRVFCVGAGAIGCELLKNMAMMGLGAGSGVKGGGKVTVTDMDSIERSNLNRQFLFHNSDIGGFKSACAARAVRAMNPDLNIVAQTNQLSREGEDGVYDGPFFRSLDLALSALDNVPAREYLDEKCAEYLVPFFDSGTMGTSGSTQIVLPRLTKSYRCIRKPVEETYPMCTLKYFPYRIHHTLHWARELFAEFFVEPALAFNTCIQIGDLQIRENLASGQGEELHRKVSSVLTFVQAGWPVSHEDCVDWALRTWHELFRDKILQLVHTFPEDAMTTEGKPFWAPPKVYPKALDYAEAGGVAEEFVWAASKLRAQMFQIPAREYGKEEFRKLVCRIKIPDFVSQEVDQSIYLQENDGGVPGEGAGVSIEQIQELLSKLQVALQGVELERRTIKELVFEKDDDSNYHMDFITAASNCRARNYSIKEADKFKSKLIAGRIAPAIATTTSVVAGLVCVEILKYVARNELSRSAHRCAFLNLAVPMIILSTPTAAPVRRWRGHEWSLWDRIRVHEREAGAVAMSLTGLLELLEKEHGLEVVIVSYGEYNLYNKYMDNVGKDKGKHLSMRELVEAVTGKKFAKGKDHLILHILCANVDNEIDVPPVFYELQGEGESP